MMLSIIIKLSSLNYHHHHSVIVVIIIVIIVIIIIIIFIIDIPWSPEPRGSRRLARADPPDFVKVFFVLLTN